MFKFESADGLDMKNLHRLPLLLLTGIAFIMIGCGRFGTPTPTLEATPTFPSINSVREQPTPTLDATQEIATLRNIGTVPISSMSESEYTTISVEEYQTVWRDALAADFIDESPYPLKEVAIWTPDYSSPDDDPEANSISTISSVWYTFEDGSKVLVKASRPNGIRANRDYFAVGREVALASGKIGMVNGAGAEPIKVTVHFPADELIITIGGAIPVNQLETIAGAVERKFPKYFQPDKNIVTDSLGHEQIPILCKNV